MFILLIFNFYNVTIFNFSIWAALILEDFYFYVFIFQVYFIVLVYLFLFFKRYKFFTLNVCLFLFTTVLTGNIIFIFLFFISFLIYFLLIVKIFYKNLLLIKNYTHHLLSFRNPATLLLNVFLFNFISFSFYFFILIFITFLYNNINFFIGNFFSLNSHTFFYLFKYDFKWLIIYVWGVPILFCIFCQCMVLLFLLSARKYDVSKSFGDNLTNWYFNNDKDILHLHNIVYYPFKVMGSSFKFIGNYLDISSLDRGLVYISSFVLILFLILVWVESLFFSMFINWCFWGFWDTECTHFNYFFKFICKYFIVLSLISVVFFNLFLALSTFVVILFIICFSFNLFINYNIDSGDYYEPMYFYLIGGNCHCIVTPSQFRVYHNIWYYKGVYWVFEETENCRRIANKEFHGYLAKFRK